MTGDKRGEGRNLEISPRNDHDTVDLKTNGKENGQKPFEDPPYR